MTAQPEPHPLSELCTLWTQFDDQAQANKDARAFALSAIRAHLLATGKQSWTDGVWRVEARKQYLLACADCGIDFRECVHSAGMNLGEEPRAMRVVKIALDDAARWIHIARVEEPQPPPRLRVLELVKDTETK